MRVLIVNTSDRTGGAAIAANRLAEALNNNGVSAKMLVMEKAGDRIYVASLNGWMKRSWCFAYERFVIWMNNLFSRKNLFAVSIANTGYDITKTQEFKEADIVHLHWVNQGMLSLRGIRKIMKSGKPVVWTMHDMWELSAICHYTYDCTNFKDECRNCHFLRFPGRKDLAGRVFRKKLKAMRGNAVYVAVSNWLADNARASRLLGGNRVEVIPNSISLSRFSIKSKIDSRDYFKIGGNKKVIVFGAARIDAEIKGFAYLKQALAILADKRETAKESLMLVMFGGCKDERVLEDIPVPYNFLGRVKGEKELSMLYSAADVVVSSSLYETFGQTLIEAQACGCIPVSFDNSGQTDIITHKENGYLARYKSVKDLADGIEWALSSGLRREDLRRNVVKRFSESVVAGQYMKLYSEITHGKC